MLIYILIVALTGCLSTHQDACSVHVSAKSGYVLLCVTSYKKVCHRSVHI
jgi:hypothetical protein